MENMNLCTRCSYLVAIVAPREGTAPRFRLDSLRRLAWLGFSLAWLGFLVLGSGDDEGLVSWDFWDHALHGTNSALLNGSSTALGSDSVVGRRMFEGPH